MGYKDPEKKKEANRERIRRYREKQKALQIGVTPNINDVTPVTPFVTVSDPPGAILPNPVEISGPDMRLFEELAGLKQRLLAVERSIQKLLDSQELVEEYRARVEDLILGLERKSPTRLGKAPDGELMFSRAKQAAGKGY